MNLLVKHGIMASAASIWLYRKKITIPNASIDADLTDFPITVYLTSSNFDFSKAKADGTDIKFTDLSGNLLKFERQEHSSVLQMGVYHIKVPSVANLTDTEIYMYYGNSAASDVQDKVNVWDANYKCVLHLGASLTDSTSNGKNGTATGTTTTDTALGKSRVFNGTSDYVTISAIQNTSEGSMAVLTKPTAMASGKKFVIDDGAGYLHLGAASGSPYNISMLAFDTAAREAISSSQYTGAYHSFEGTYKNGSAVTLDVDGTTRITGASMTGNLGGVAAALKIGKNGSEYTNMEMAEFRYSNIARSAAWTKAESLSMKNALVAITDA
jgi:biopolymer transport protein ExbB